VDFKGRGHRQAATGGCRDATDAFLAEQRDFALARLGSSVAVVHRAA
jgi:hypothetical protein